MNLASLPTEDRLAIEADKFACLIRHRSRHLQGRERQVCALNMMDAHSEDQRERIKTAMRRRAGK